MVVASRALGRFVAARVDGLAHRPSGFTQEPEARPVKPAAPPPFRFDSPDDSSETIGWYMGTPIHRSARFKGVEYEFDRICPPRSLRRASGERVLAPGLVYTRRAAIRPR
jgi:hypothetical protein